MSFTLKSAAAAAALSCVMAGASPALAAVSPDIMNLLIVTAEKDGGANLDLVAKLAIAAKPDAEKDILELVANLKRKIDPKDAPETTPEINAVEIAAGPATPVPEQAATATPAAPMQADKAALAEDNPGYFSLRGWDGEVELNILQTTGNTRQQSFGLGGKMERNADKFHHTITTFFDLNKNDGEKDKQKWGLAYKLDYDFSEKLYVTAFAGYENDQFGAFRERVTTSLGIGYPIIIDDKYSWKVEGGPSILFTKELPGESYSSSFNGFANSIFKWTINDRSNFSNKTVVFFGNRSVIESKSALKVKINGALSSKFSYDIFYDRDAPLERKKTDTIARAGLLYDF